MRVLLIALLAAISYAQTEIAWTIPVADQTITASVGDTLTFKWNGGHNVFRVPDADAYAACDFSSATEVCATSNGDGGGCTATLDTLPAYFACEVTGHCGGGQKLTVNAAEDAGGDDGACPTACSTAISGIECLNIDGSSLSSLSDCASFESMTSCMSEYTAKTEECSDAAGGDCAEACTNAINAMDCATMTEGEYPDACTVTTGCATVLSDKAASCANPGACPSSCATAISGASCTDYSAAALANLEGCEAADTVACASEGLAKTSECTSNSESNCPSACASAISAVDCSNGFTAASIPNLDGCGPLDGLSCLSEGTAKLSECSGDSNDSGASGLSVVFAFVAFAFSQF